MALHTTIGPAGTTITAIAERAGVERHTVYAHFPEERALQDACTAHWYELHPFPDTAAWLAITDPERQLRRALGDVYSWYEATGRDLASIRRDAAVHQLTAEKVGAFDRLLADLSRQLASGWGRRRRVHAAIGHALSFETWQSLARQGLSRRASVDLMVRLAVAARGSGR